MDEEPLVQMVKATLKESGRMLRCPSCKNCSGHTHTFNGQVEFYVAGNPTAIHDCRFCDAIICMCCYIEHTERDHAELDKRSTDSSSSCSGSDRRARSKRSRRSAS